MQGRVFLAVALAIALALGAWLRLDQIAGQVLMEDEWHVVHQVTYYSAGHILQTFGNADYGIPVALLYLLEANTIGLSELDARLPMLIAGIGAVVLIPLMLRDRFEGRTLSLFAFLLAASPFLISYSRMARTYPLTLLGIYAAFWFFQRSIRNDRVSWIDGWMYALLCALTAWTHVLASVMLVVPLLAQWVLAWRRRSATRPLLLLTALTGALMALAVLPPLLADPVALSSKTGRDSISGETIAGAWHFFVGTGSGFVAVTAALLAALGFTQTWRVPIVRWIWIGTALTLIVLIAARPWWVDHPIALARYLMPAIPAALLAICAGLMRIVRGIPQWLGASVIAGALLGWFLTTPTLDLLVRPNSYAQHPYFQEDYRVGHSALHEAFAARLVTQFWFDLSRMPRGSVTVAAAPFHYTTYQWPAPVWEEASGQRVIPAFLWGSCMGSRHGEVPPDDRFRFRNAVHLGDRASWKSHGVDYIVYLKEFAEKDCEAWARSNLGLPQQEDSQLIVWKVSTRP